MGKVEDAAPVYNVSFLATRTFVLAGLEHAGKKERKDFAGGIIREWPMFSGDLVVLPPKVNAATVHGVPREPAVAEKRVSLVFRHVTKHWVCERDGAWLTCQLRPDGSNCGWKSLGEHVDTVEERVAKRRRTE
jgi:hypothetical protein